MPCVRQDDRACGPPILWFRIYDQPILPAHRNRRQPHRGLSMSRSATAQGATASGTIAAAECAQEVETDSLGLERSGLAIGNFASEKAAPHQRRKINTCFFHRLPV